MCVVSTTHPFSLSAKQVWGKPSFEQLMQYMKQVYDDKVRRQSVGWALKVPCTRADWIFFIDRFTTRTTRGRGT